MSLALSCSARSSAEPALAPVRMRYDTEHGNDEAATLSRKPCGAIERVSTTH
jgi:hypothetical protein